MTLHQRMEYLSRAIMCAKGSTQATRATTEGEFLHQLEDKMEVARLQLQVGGGGFNGHGAVCLSFDCD